MEQQIDLSQNIFLEPSSGISEEDDGNEKSNPKIGSTEKKQKKKHRELKIIKIKSKRKKIKIRKRKRKRKRKQNKGKIHAKKNKLKYPSVSNLKKITKLEEGEYHFELFNLENMEKSVYCRNNLENAFISTHKPTNSWYVYEMYFGMNLLNDRKSTTLKETLGFDNKVIKIFFKKILFAYKMANNYLKLGKTRFTLQFSKSNLLVYQDAHLIIDPKGFTFYNDNFDEITSHKWKTDISYGINKMFLNVGSIESLQPKFFHGVKFENSIEKWVVFSH